MSKSAIPKGGNDCIMTPDSLALAILPRNPGALRVRVTNGSGRTPPRPHQARTLGAPRMRTEHPGLVEICPP